MTMTMTMTDLDRHNMNPATGNQVLLAVARPPSSTASNSRPRRRIHPSIHPTIHSHNCERGQRDRHYLPTYLPTSRERERERGGAGRLARTSPPPPPPPPPPPLHLGRARPSRRSLAACLGTDLLLLLLLLRSFILGDDDDDDNNNNNEKENYRRMAPAVVYVIKIKEARIQHNMYIHIQSA
ncbi:hypothetical protein IWX92DRAFT_129241 [Phyllosticta citricarpa]